MVPASTSQSASVSGISSPSGRGSTRTNWPGLRRRPRSAGELTVNSSMPSAEVRLGEDRLRRGARARCTPGRARPCRGSSSARQVDARRGSRGPPPGRHRPRGWPSSRRGPRRHRCRRPRASSPASPRGRGRSCPTWTCCSRGSESLMIGLAALPSAMITRSACMVSVRAGGDGAPAPGVVGLAELHDVERGGGDEAGLVVAEELRRRAQLAQGDALLEGVVQLLDAGGHLRAGCGGRRS